LIGRGVGPRGIERGFKIAALDDGNELPRGDFVPFPDSELLNAAGNLRADYDLIGVNRADELQFLVRRHGDEVIDQRAQTKHRQNEEDPVACVHLFFTSIRGSWTGLIASPAGMGVSAST